MNANLVVPETYDAERVWRDFPILRREVHDKPLVFLDSAASSQRPANVIAAVDRYETYSHANVHRGVHQLSQEATGLFEHARERVRAFVNAASTRAVIFTRGTTESINLVDSVVPRVKMTSRVEAAFTKRRTRSRACSNIAVASWLNWCTPRCTLAWCSRS